MSPAWIWWASRTWIISYDKKQNHDEKKKNPQHNDGTFHSRKQYCSILTTAGFCRSLKKRNKSWLLHNIFQKVIFFFSPQNKPLTPTSHPHTPPLWHSCTAVWLTLHSSWLSTSFLQREYWASRSEGDWRSDRRRLALTFSPADARGRRSAQFLWRSGQSESPEGRPGEEIIPHCSLNTLSRRLPLPVVSPQRRCVAAKCVHGGAAVRSRPLAVRLSVSWVGSLQDVLPNYFIVGCFKRDTSRFYCSFQLVLLLNFGFAFLPSEKK